MAYDLKIYVIKKEIKILTLNYNIMKKLSFLLLFIAIAIFSFGQITGSAHDFKAATWNVTDNSAGSTGFAGEICVTCHTPHSAQGVPLWSRDATAITSYTLYASPTFDSDGGADIADPTGTSLACLSCHDGTVALSAFNKNTSVAVTKVTKLVGANTAGDLSLEMEHPINFTYDASHNDVSATVGGLFDPTTKLVGATAGEFISTEWLFSNKVQCGSCHDVHNKFGINKLLRKTNVASALCLTCHNK